MCLQRGSAGVLLCANSKGRATNDNTQKPQDLNVRRGTFRRLHFHDPNDPDRLHRGWDSCLLGRRNVSCLEMWLKCFQSLFLKYSWWILHPVILALLKLNCHRWREGSTKQWLDSFHSLSSDRSPQLCWLFQKCFSPKSELRSLNAFCCVFFTSLVFFLFFLEGFSLNPGHTNTINVALAAELQNRDDPGVWGLAVTTNRLFAWMTIPVGICLAVTEPVRLQCQPQNTVLTNSLQQHIIDVHSESTTDRTHSKCTSQNLLVYFQNSAVRFFLISLCVFFFKYILDIVLFLEFPWHFYTSWTCCKIPLCVSAFHAHSDKELNLRCAQVFTCRRLCLIDTEERSGFLVHVK